MDGKAITKRINDLLWEKRIPKKDFYSGCGITSAAYSLWNTGKNNPSPKTIEAIVNYLNTTEEYLLTGHGEKYRLHNASIFVEDEAIAALEALREEERALLQVTRGMTVDQVKVMTEFAKMLRGKTDAD